MKVWSIQIFCYSTKVSSKAASGVRFVNLWKIKMAIQFTILYPSINEVFPNLYSFQLRWLKISQTTSYLGTSCTPLYKKLDHCAVVELLTYLRFPYQYKPFLDRKSFQNRRKFHQNVRLLSSFTKLPPSFSWLISRLVCSM